MEARKNSFVRLGGGVGCLFRAGWGGRRPWTGERGGIGLKKDWFRIGKEGGERGRCVIFFRLMTTEKGDGNVGCL